MHTNKPYWGWSKTYAKIYLLVSKNTFIFIKMNSCHLIY
ncbi:hypothetical protein CZ794_13900 [Psychrobacter sp. JB385]|nr:hypothetical protein CZ794_13900 [Psychrobacter sp. JB385]